MSAKTKLPISVQLVSLVAVVTIVISLIQIYFLVAVPQVAPPGVTVLDSPQWASSVGVRIGLLLTACIALGLALLGTVENAARAGVVLCLVLLGLVAFGLWELVGSESTLAGPASSQAVMYLMTRISAAVFLIWLGINLKKTLQNYRAEF